jgi:hypothetical protein
MSVDSIGRAYRVYRRRVARCRTENQVNRVHIVLGNYATPAEIRHFNTLLARDNADQSSRGWLAGFRGMMPHKAPRAEEFERKGFFPSMSLYSSNAGPRSDKTLLIGFAGNFHRLSMPAPVFLDCFDPALYDVIILRDFSRGYFVRGMPGLGGSFFEAMTRMRQLVDPRVYRNAIALGTSSGGLLAIFAALLLGLPRGVCVGGMDFPQFTEIVTRLGVAPGPYADLLASRPNPYPELLIVYSGHYAVDVKAAEGLHGRIPSRLLGVKHCEEHGVLGWKLAQGRLPPFLSKLLGQSLERSDAPAMTETR